METEQESSQPKSLSKSYRRRQRRKEAASLRKQTSEVVLEKEEYSIQTQDKRSGANKKIATENTVTVLCSKDTDEPSPSQFGSKGVDAKKLKKLSDNINEDIDTHEEKLLETEKILNISRSKRRRNRKKALLSAALGNEIKENPEIKEGPPLTSASKIGVPPNLFHTCSQETCVPRRDCLTLPNKFSCRDCESLVPSSRKNFEKSIVIEKICKTCQNSCIDTEKKDFSEEENIKVKKDTTVDQKLNQITKEKKYKKRKACGNLEELIDYIEGCDINESSGVLELKRNIGKSEDIPKIPSNSEIDISEKQSKSSLVFQQSNIYSSNSSESHCRLNFDCHPVVTENTTKAVVVESAESEMNKTEEKAEKQSQGSSSANKNDLCKNKNDKLVSGMITDNLNQKVIPKVHEECKEKAEKLSQGSNSANKNDLHKNDKVGSGIVTDNLNQKATSKVGEKVEKEGKEKTEKQSPCLGSASKNDEVGSGIFTDNLNQKATSKAEKEVKDKTEKPSPGLVSVSKSDLHESKNDEVGSGIVADNLHEKVTAKVEKEGSEKSKEEVKAEREARKAEKMAKKQKKVISPNLKEINVATVCSSLEKHELVEDETGKGNIVVNTEADLATKPIQNSESNISTKSKAELRAERRAKQEAQRAAKAAAAGSANLSSSIQIKAKTVDSSNISKVPVDYNKVKEVKEVMTKGKVIRREQGAKLLSRLGWEDSRSQKWSENTLQVSQLIHPAIVQLGTRFTDRIISGSNARCIAFVQAIKKAIQDYQTPPQKELGRDLEARLLAPSLAYLESQRPHAVSVSNATRFLKWQLTQLQPLQLCSSDSKSKKVLPDEEAKHNLIEGLDSYIWEKIEVAEQAVCDTLSDKIKDGDVILTYGCSYLLQQILIGAKRAGTKFKVVVVDGRPWREGREMLRCLVAMGIPCSYVLLSAASSVMRQVNKVLLGAHALLSNGYVMSRVGVSQVALLASAHNVPVLVACETHKFCERVQSDSFVYNEMGEPDGLAQLLGGEDGPLSGWRTLPCLSLLNLSYDVTPPELVTAVATELAVLPCTSVPVVLRVRPTEPVASRH